MTSVEKKIGQSLDPRFLPMAEIQSLAAKYNIQQMLYVSRLRDTALKCSDITKREDFCAFTKYQNKSGFLSLNPK